MTGKIVFKENSYRIIGACFEVHKEKGNGFLEAVYQECLARELAEQEIPFERFVNQPLSRVSRVSLFQQTRGRQIDAVDTRTLRH